MIEVPRPDLVAFAIVGDGLWTVSGVPPMLEVEGHPERLRLPGRTGRLVRAGTRRAVWLGDGGGEVAVVSRTALGLDIVRIPDAELALPLSDARTVVCRRGVVEMRDTVATRWSAAVRDGRVVEGAVVLDGRAIALHVDERAERGRLVVLDVRTGAVQHRIALHGAAIVRFAAGRGVALAVLDRRRLVLIDLRFGRVLANELAGRTIADAAIDEAGLRIVVRYDHAHGDVAELDADELVRAPSPEPLPELDNDPPGIEVVVPVEPVPAPPVTPAVLGPIRALPVRAAPVLPAPGLMNELLDAQRALVVALIDHAIAARASRDELVHASMRLDEAYEAWWSTLAAIPGRAPLHALADEHGLDELAQHGLLVIAAPALWGDLAPRYGALANDAARALCDEQLVAAALATLAFPHEVAAVLDPDAPLVRRGLVHAGGGVHRPFLALTVDPIVLRVLRGGSPLGALGRSIQRRGATRAFGELHVADAVKHRLVEELACAPAPLRVIARGRTGSGRHTLLACIAAAADRELGVIEAGALLPSLDELRTAMQRAALAGLVPCLDGLERAASLAPAVRDGVREVVRSHAGPVFVRLPADARVPIEPGYVGIELPVQNVAERAAAWHASLATAGLELPDLDELAARFALGPGVIQRVVEHVAHDPGPRSCDSVRALARSSDSVRALARSSDSARSLARSSDSVCAFARSSDSVRALARSSDSVRAFARIETVIHQHLDREIAAVATRVERLPAWSSVILPPEIQDSITELIARIRHKRTVFDDWGFDRVMSTSRGLTALFQGGPGTGKTLVAAAIANELGLDLYRVDVSRIMSKWIGETEQNLARLFDAAHDGNAIIVFDEADSLFSKRTEVKSSNDRFANLEVNYLLQRLDSFDGIAILTSNFGSAIDAAFKRRLSFRLTFPFPDEELRERLWRAHLPARLPLRGELDLGALARRYRLSGGYIRNCALRAGFLAAEQGALTAHHLERAIQAEFREIGKLSDSGVLE